MAKTGNQRYPYGFPNPFGGPALQEAISSDGFQFVFGLGFGLTPSDFFSHEMLAYSGPVLENIMFMVSLEFEFRGMGRQSWKKYAGPDDFEVFFARGSRQRFSPFQGARTLGGTRNPDTEAVLDAGFPVKWFPLYIRDIQEKILELVDDGNYPDTIQSLNARIWSNNVSNAGTTWTDRNALPNTLKILTSKTKNTKDGDGFIEINPRARLITGFPFPAEDPELDDLLPRLGIDFKGEAYVYRSPLGVVTHDEPTASNFKGDGKNAWPRSVIGKRRDSIISESQKGATIRDGFFTLFDEEGNPLQGDTIDGIDAIHMPGRPEGRQDNIFRQIPNERAQLPTEAGKPDKDSGYSFIGHHPYVLHQLRYQPPLVERWASGNSRVRDYVENLFSNLTPNLPWYFSQPVEKVLFSDWGGWLVQGRCGIDAGGLKLEAYPDPQHNNLFTQCPYQVFYPGPTSNCSCGGANTAYGLWGNSLEPLVWNQQFVNNELPNSGFPKSFGPNTRLQIEGTFSLGNGTGSNGGSYWAVGVRTTRIGPTNLQPFVFVMGVDQTPQGVNIFPGGGMSVNLMDAMQFHYPNYTKEGVDFVLAIGIFVQTQSGESQVVQAEDGPGGSFIPATDLGCQIGTSSASVRRINFFEPAIGDIPNLFDRTVVPPPEYPLPIV